MDPETLLTLRYRHPIMPYVEDVERYAPGGFHPVDIGDRICAGAQAYQVLHKLGHGGSSTVWLVQSCVRLPSYYALKIFRADVADMTEARELSILEHLKSFAGPRHPNLVVLYDTFKISGLNGERYCLLFPVLGLSLRKVHQSTTLGGALRHQVCQQATSAIELLHHRGICHGDLTVSNLVFELPNHQSMSPDEVSRLLGPIKTEKLRSQRDRSHHGPRFVVQTPKFSGFDYSRLSRIRIIGFGQAFHADQPPRSLGVPLSYFPPELCFGYLPSAKSDVWQLACILYETHTDHYLFPTFFEIFEILIGTAVGLFGPIPQHWRGNYNFDEYGYVEP